MLPLNMLLLMKKIHLMSILNIKIYSFLVSIFNLNMIYHMTSRLRVI